MIWVYFFLLIFEGALRKWIVPSLSNPLLIIRDPAVLAIYVIAYRNGLFPRNGFLLWGGILALLMLPFGVIGEYGSLPVAFYGLRTDFFHVPLIFIMAKVWTTQDVKKMGYWLLVLALPLTFLMALQFRAAPTSWLNTGAGGQLGVGGQLASAGGHVRASATFSFISGPVLYFSLVSVFLLHSQLSRSRYANWLLLSSTVALLIACAVSGSRSLVLNIGVVVACALICSTIIQPFLMFRWLGAGALVGVLALGAQNLKVTQEGTQVFSQRVSNASSSEGGSSGLMKRFFGDFDVSLAVNESPLLGYGLGSGTNAGAAIASGKRQGFQLAEGEWGRVVAESGPILGIFFILWRISIAVWIGNLALRHALRGNTLPFLLFGTGVLNLISGQWGQPTTQGFAIITGGLCLAAMRVPVTKRPRSVSSGRKTSTSQPQFVPAPVPTHS